MTNWKQIEGFPNYSVSEEGRVRNDRRMRVLKPLVMSKGYHGQRLYINNTQAKTVKLHRLVALAFLPNPLNLPQVNHKDGNKANNHRDNLEWCDGFHNMRHAFDTGLNANRPKHGHLLPKILELHRNGLSTRAISEMVAVPKSTVALMIKKEKTQ